MIWGTMTLTGPSSPLGGRGGGMGGLGAGMKRVSPSTCLARAPFFLIVVWHFLSLQNFFFGLGRWASMKRFPPSTFLPRVPSFPIVGWHFLFYKKRQLLLLTCLPMNDYQSFHGFLCCVSCCVLPRPAFWCSHIELYQMHLPPVVGMVHSLLFFHCFHFPCFRLASVLSYTLQPIQGQRRVWEDGHPPTANGHGFSDYVEVG